MSEIDWDGPYEDIVVDLQKENAELRARVARLEEASINLVNVLPHHNGAFVKDAIQDVYTAIKESQQAAGEN